MLPKISDAIKRITKVGGCEMWKIKLYKIARYLLDKLRKLSMNETVI